MGDAEPRRRPPVPAPTACDSYRAGHRVHWIQAKKASAERGGRRRGRIVETGADWLVVRLGDGQRCRYRNHDIPRLEALMDHYGTRATMQERWSLLRIGRHLVSVSRVGDVVE